MPHLIKVVPRSRFVLEDKRLFYCPEFMLRTWVLSALWGEDTIDARRAAQRHRLWVRTCGKTFRRDTMDCVPLCPVERRAQRTP
jgi:hypothetical protein